MKKNEWLKSLLFFVGVALIVVILRGFVFTPVMVKGDSMDPTLNDGEHVFALKHTAINRFDVVTFPAPDEPGRNYIKRVIGLPGDSVEYKDDQLYINGKKYDEPYLDEYKSKLTDGLPLTNDFKMTDYFETETVPKGKLLVLGDNRRISKDSRIIGLVDEDSILGDVKFIFWPLNKIGTVEH
ncbi:signal peptidase I [Enterococcus mediterraneensis]|uniref:signal peptidase I n=1 Tax=Enterococcus mediterraneensis TaxID=2364791 RepID=UPI000F04AC28|nr:signal peptidase I [Enterococcus mediterraneensis]